MKHRDGSEGLVGEEGRAHQHHHYMTGINNILAHVDALIDRQQQEFDEIAMKRPGPRIRMDRAKDRISKLRYFRCQLAHDDNPDPVMLDQIRRDMAALGW